ncbi:hypothetical protein OAF73_01450, partial [Planctomycetota bacterium]|nr:hypothetical protein [Planctomycetota bacterium]
VTHRDVRMHFAVRRKADLMRVLHERKGRFRIPLLPVETPERGEGGRNFRVRFAVNLACEFEFLGTKCQRGIPIFPGFMERSNPVERIGDVRVLIAVDAAQHLIEPRHRHARFFRPPKIVQL